MAGDQDDDAAGPPKGGRSPIDPPNPEFTSPDQWVVGGWEIAGLGGYIVGCVVLGLLVGWLIDHHWDSSPVGILIGLAVGIVVAVVGSCVRIARYLRR